MLMLVLCTIELCKVFKRLKLHDVVVLLRSCLYDLGYQGHLTPWATLSDGELR